MRGFYRRARLNMNVDTRARGKAVIQVLDADLNLLQEVEVKNLILNVGIDAVRARPWVQNMEYCVVGSNATATSDPSGATQAVQSGTTVTLTGGAFVFTDTATDAGKIIRWNAGSEARIVTITDPTHAEVANSATVANGLFTVYRTNQTVLNMTEIQRSNTYVTAGAGCGTTIVGNVITHKRTFDFPSEVGTVTYREVALSHSATPGAEIFSRIRLPSDLTLVVNQIMRVIYSLELTLGPNTQVAKAADIIGWPVAPATDTEGDEQVQVIGLATVSAVTGATTVGVGTGISLEPSSVGADCAVFMSTVSTALAAFGSAVDRTGTSPAIKTDTAIDNDTVTAGVGNLDKVATFLVGEGNRTDWRTLGIGTEAGAVHPYVVTGFAFVFDQAQTKDNLHTLELRFNFTWGRDLS